MLPSNRLNRLFFSRPREFPAFAAVAFSIFLSARASADEPAPVSSPPTEVLSPNPYTDPGSSPAADAGATPGESKEDPPPRALSPNPYTVADPSPHSSSQPAKPVEKPDQKPEEVAEVKVQGAKNRAARPALSASQVRKIPGAFGDAFRAVEVMPGIVPIASGVPFFFVRGAPPGNVGYFLDGVRLPALFHLGVGPSLIHPGLIDRVDFYPATYPAEYGRFAGGIIAGHTKAPLDRTHGEANVRVFDAGALVEGRLTEKVGATVAGRYSYAGLIAPVVSPGTRFSYWDHYTRVFWDVDEKTRLTATVFGSDDSLSQFEDQAKDYKEQLAFSFYRGDLRIDRAISDTGQLRAGLTLGYDRSRQQELLGATSTMIAGRVGLEESLGKQVRLRLGADFIRSNYKISSEASPPIWYAPRTDWGAGAYAEVGWTPVKVVEITPSIRTDLFSSSDSEDGTFRRTTIDPRLRGRFYIGDSFRWNSAVGVAHQRPSMLVQLPGLELASLKSGPQTALQLSQGFEWLLPAAFTISVTGFAQRYLNMTDATSTCTEPKLDTGANNCAAQTVTGRAHGLEFVVRRALSERVAGLIAYTYSRSFREMRVLQPTPHVVVIPSEFDRPHVLNAILTVDLGAGWSAGGRFMAYSGRPYSPLFEGAFYPPYNAQRLDGFERLDVRLEKRWKLSETGHIAVILEGLNVLMEKEAIAVSCNWNLDSSRRPNTTRPSRGSGCFQNYVGPITVPSIGVEGAL